MHLGDFGTPHEALDDTFSYFGTTLRVHPDLTDLFILEVSREYQGSEPEDSWVRTAARSVVHPDDFDEFWRLALANRQNIEEINGFLNGIIEAITNRPTELSSDSSGGRQPTSESSTDGSFSRALEVLDGRPDLQLAVVNAQESRAG